MRPRRPARARRTGASPAGDASRGDADARKGGDGTYTVRAGDNLWAIADAQELPGGWTALYEANKDELGSDPDLILPGQNLDLGLDLGAKADEKTAGAGAEAAAGN